VTGAAASDARGAASAPSERLIFQSKSSTVIPKESTMAKLIRGISMSLDGFIAGPNASVEHPLGERGMRLHEWAFELAQIDAVAAPGVTHLTYRAR
jgi:hypothetical protein